MARNVFLILIFSLFTAYFFGNCYADEYHESFPEGKSNKEVSVRCGSENYHLHREGIRNSLLKFQREKKGTVAFLGGSITHNGGWRDSICIYLQKRFPDTDFEFIAAGIPSMGSTPAAFRLERDVLSGGSVDLLFEEAAVNDAVNGTSSQEQIRAMEGIVRHVRRENPATDIVIMHFVDPQKMATYRSGQVPEVIHNHEKVAAHYGLPTINLAREVTERIDAGEFTWEDDFRNLHPSPFGQGVYSNSMKAFLEKAWSEDVAEGDNILAYPQPEPLDRACYENGKLILAENAIVIQGWEMVENWNPKDGKGTRANYVNVPMLVGQHEGSVLEFRFTGNAVGIAVAAGPDAGIIEYQVDDGNWIKQDLFTRSSMNLHLPRYYTLAADLFYGNHTLRLRIAGDKNPRSIGTACRIRYFFVNAITPEKGQTGDEQGLEIPENIRLQQDKDAIHDAFSGWWTESMKTRDERVEWFNDVKFGCFIHWGVSSPAGNEWNGTGGLGYSEHLMRSRKIPLSEYKSKLVETFNPVRFDAEEWMKAASEAGMKYFIITAKHHDGFAMYPSDVYPYDIRLTQFDRDPMRELRDAATKYGLKFGFYYSHAFDWEHPDAPGNDWDYQNPGGDKLLHGSDWWENYPQFLVNAEKYVDEKSIPQIRELIRNYKPDIMWFDTPHKLPLYLNLKILKAIREVAPDIPVNGRLARMGGQNFGDYVNTGDRAAFFRQTPGFWEAIPTTNESYGYNKFDLTHKSPEHFVQLIASAAAKGGNLLLNVGPMGDGRWDERDVNILKDIGSWMKTYGVSIYGTERNPLPVQSWGEITKKGNDLYLHVFQWPDDGKLIVAGFKANVEEVCLVADPEQKLRSKKINDWDLEINLPKAALDTMNTVIKLVYSGSLQTNPVRLLSTRTPNQLLVFDAELHGQGFTYGDGKPNREYVSNWKSSDQYLSWDFRLTNPTEFSITLKYNTDKPDDRGVVFIDVNGSKFQVNYPLMVNETTDPVKRNNDPSSTIVVGRIKLDEGLHQLKLLPGEYQGQQLMRPLSISLVPIK